MTVSDAALTVLSGRVPADVEGSAKIMICDDSRTIRAMIANLLRGKYELLLTSTAEELLGQLDSFGPDLIISNLLMESMDGYELLRRVRARPELENLPVVFLTSKTDEDSRVSGLEQGADDYLFKPIRPRELLARVSSVLRLRRVTADLHRRTKELERVNEELKTTQAVMVQREKLASLGQLAAGIAHELNNPINSCYGNTHFLREHVDALLRLVDWMDAMPAMTMEQRELIDEVKTLLEFDYVRNDIEKLIESVREGAERAAVIVRDLLSFSRLGTGELQQTNLGQTMKMALTVSKHELRDRISVHCDVLESPLVRCDSSKIGQVFVNLVVNAAQAIKGKGEIFISMQEDGPWMRCSIRDTGTGIPEKIQPRIFDPFFSTKPVGKGTGLGLSVSYNIVQQHGGMLEVQSVEGSGTTFTMVLPIAGPKIELDSSTPEHTRENNPPGIRFRPTMP